MGVSKLRRGVLAVTLLLGAVAVGMASMPPRPLRSVVAAVYAVSLRMATYWLVVVALLQLADRLAGDSRRVDRRAIWRLSAVVFLGAVAIELGPLVRQLAGVAASGQVTDLLTTVPVALQDALFPAAAFLGVGLAVLALRSREPGPDADRGSSLPVAPDDGIAHDRLPTAVWRLGRVLAAATLAHTVLGAVAAGAGGRSHVLVLTTDAALAALAGFVDHAVLGVVILALFAGGATRQSLPMATAFTWVITFVLGIAVGLLGALASVVLVAATTAPIPVVDSATLIVWPNPVSVSSLLTTGAVLATGVGLRLIHGPIEEPMRDRPSTTTDSSDA